MGYLSYHVPILYLFSCPITFKHSEYGDILFYINIWKSLWEFILKNCLINEWMKESMNEEKYDQSHFYILDRLKTLHSVPVSKWIRSFHWFWIQIWMVNSKEIHPRHYFKIRQYLCRKTIPHFMFWVVKLQHLLYGKQKGCWTLLRNITSWLWSI